MIKFEKVVYKIFSGLIFLVAIIGTLVITNFFGFNKMLVSGIENLERIESTPKLIILIINEIIILFTIKEMFFGKKIVEKERIVLKNSYGKLEITKTFLEKLITNTVLESNIKSNIKSINTKVKIDKKNKLFARININIIANNTNYLENTNEETGIIQEKIKAVVKESINQNIEHIDITVN